MVGIAVKNFTLNLQLFPISHVLSPQIGDAEGAPSRRRFSAGANADDGVVESEKWGRDRFLHCTHVCLFGLLFLHW